MKKKVKTGRTELQEALIANPIYDNAFKYMMEDRKVASTFISTVIGEKIVELSSAPQEHVKTENSDVPEKSLSVYRLDFVARIQTGEGMKTVMIEVQKVSLNTDIMRFRSYLGGQYQNDSNSYPDSQKNIHAMPIYCIFVIGDGIGIEGVPVIKVDSRITDAATSRELTVPHNEFIEGLHHRTWIVQVPELKGRRSNDLEILLSIFDQANRMNDRRILNIKEEHFPEEYSPIIRRLQQAAANRKIREAMLNEDYVLEHFRIEERKKDIIIAQKDTVIAEKETVIAEKEATIAEKEALLARERAEKEALLAELAALKAKSNTEK